MSRYYFICLAMIRSFARLSETLSWKRARIARTRAVSESGRGRERKNTGVSAMVNKTVRHVRNGKWSTDRGRLAAVKITHGRKHKNAAETPRSDFFFSASACPPVEENKGSAGADNQRIQLKATVR